MKPFALENVLKYRKRQEDNAVLRLTTAIRNKEVIRKRLIILQQQRIEIDIRIKKIKETPIEISDLIRCENRIYWLKQQEEKENKELDSATKKIQKERQNVLKKSREKKALEKLKVKQNSNWKKYLEKKENAQLDEIAVLSYEPDQSK